MKYRSRTDLIAGVLSCAAEEIGGEGAPLTHIMYKSFLSYRQVKSISKIESPIQEKQKDNTFSRKRCFLMCKSCYWCASCLSADDGSISICPVCGTNKMDCLSISHSECYRLDYDQIRGMVLQFWTEIEGDIPS